MIQKNSCRSKTAYLDWLSSSFHQLFLFFFHLSLSFSDSLSPFSLFPSSRSFLAFNVSPFFKNSEHSMFESSEQIWISEIYKKENCTTCWNVKTVYVAIIYYFTDITERGNVFNPIIVISLSSVCHLPAGFSYYREG